MPLITFIQFTRPYGKTKMIEIDRPAHVAERAAEIKAAGYRLEAELLSTGEVSLTIVGPDADEAIEVVQNGPRVIDAVDRLILQFLMPEVPK